MRRSEETVDAQAPSGARLATFGNLRITPDNKKISLDNKKISPDVAFKFSRKFEHSVGR